VLRKLLAIAYLPAELLAFAHEKRFSIKQCFHLARHAPELLVFILSLKEGLSLSASNLEQLADHIKDILVASDTTLERFREQSGIMNIIANNELSLHQKTPMVMDKVRELRYPKLTEIRGRMDKIKRELQLPQGMSLGWDPTLETRELKVELILKPDTNLSEVATKLNSSSFALAAEQLLEEL
jgi:hypothetical protein